MKSRGNTPVYTGLDKVRFRNSVRPGDEIRVTARIERRMGTFFFAAAEAHVGDKLCVQGTSVLRAAGGLNVFQDI